MRSRHPLPNWFPRGFSDLLAVVLASSITLPLALYTTGPVRVAFAVVFLLFSPGYSLVAALYSRRDAIDIVERLALSVGTSIAIVPLIGLALNYTPYGIRLAPILLSVYGFTLVTSAVACRLRLRLLPEERYQIRWSFPGIRWVDMERKDRILNGALLASIVFAAGVLIFVVTTPREAETFTEFYILGPGGYADNYPQTMHVQNGTTLTLGIVNHENATANYRVEATLDGNPDALTMAPEGAEAHQVSDSAFELDDIGDEAEWEHEIAISPLAAGEKQKLEFLLFSSQPRVGYHLRGIVGEDGYVSIKLDEENGKSEVTLTAGETSAAECHIEAWQNGSLVARETASVEAGGLDRHTFKHPQGTTLFKVYEGDTLVIDDSGAMLALHLWVDVSA